MTYLLIALGGFLLGGAIAFWRNPERSSGHLVFALIFLAGAVLAVVAAILRM